MVAMAAAAARAQVSPPQPGLHAGGPGGGDGSGPGSARGARAELGPPAASPGSGSGSGRGRALWHEQGGPLHPRRSSARPSLASAAPLGPPAGQSLSPAVPPSGHRSPPQERSEKQTAGRAACPLACHSLHSSPIPGSRGIFVPPPLISAANNKEEVAVPAATRPLSTAVSPTPSQPPANQRHHTMDQSRLLSQDANGRSQGGFRGLSTACQSSKQPPVHSIGSQSHRGLGSPASAHPLKACRPSSRRCRSLQSQLVCEAPPTASSTVSQRRFRRRAGWRGSPPATLGLEFRKAAGWPPRPSALGALRGLGGQCPASPSLCPRRVRNKRGGFWLEAIPGAWPPPPWDPLACPPVQKLRLPGGKGASPLLAFFCVLYLLGHTLRETGVVLHCESSEIWEFDTGQGQNL